MNKILLGVLVGGVSVVTAIWLWSGSAAFEDIITTASAATTTTSTALAHGVVTLSFDDGWGSQVKNAAPALKAAHLPATFYIITSAMQEAATDTSPQIGPSEVLALQADGFEIGDHTRTHPDLTKISNASATAEIVGAKNDLIAAGVKAVNTLAYPFGSTNASIKSIVSSSGLTAARGTVPGFNDKASDMLNLSAEVVTTSTSLTDMETLVNQAIQNKKWLIFVFHHVGTEKTPTTPSDLNIDPATFSSFVSFLQSHNVPVMNVRDAVAFVNGNSTTTNNGGGNSTSTNSTSTNSTSTSSGGNTTSTTSTVTTGGNGGNTTTTTTTSTTSTTVTRVNNPGITVTVGGGGAVNTFSSAGSAAPIAQNGSGGGSFVGLVPNTGAAPIVLGTSTTSGTDALQTLQNLMSQLMNLERELITINLRDAKCSPSFTKDLSLGMTDPEVRMLQETLNDSTVTMVASSGTGSRGEETSYFGKKTMKALQMFQAIFTINENGFVGPVTRAALNTLCSMGNGV